MADAIQSWVDEALNQWVAGNNQAGAAALNNATALVDKTLDAGCFVTGIAV